MLVTLQIYKDKQHLSYSVLQMKVPCSKFSNMAALWVANLHCASFHFPTVKGLACPAPMQILYAEFEDDHNLSSQL